MSHHTQDKSDVKLLSDKIKGIRIAMMTTIEQDNMLQSRPMGRLFSAAKGAAMGGKDYATTDVKLNMR